MKVVIAIDSFKGSMSSVEAGEASRKGILRAINADVIVKPLADGGEGTTEALIEGLGGRFIEVAVVGPMGDKVIATYGILQDGVTAVMEMASASGITLVKKEMLNPWSATTFGVGQMIADAMKKGCKNFIIGIGGSATTDGGTGMLMALGYEFLDCDGRAISYGIKELDRIAYINAERRLAGIEHCNFQIACDVKNPLCGGNGAVYVYGKQKGVREQDMPALDEKMKHFARITSEFVGRDYSCVDGAGAAGGLGFAFLSYLPNVQLKPGIEVVINAIGLEGELRDADIVVTGEGRLDTQTVMGKAPAGVAELAKKYGCKVIAFAGSVTEDAIVCNEKGIDAFFPIVRGATTLEEAMEKENAKRNMELAVEQVFRVIK